LYCEFALRYDLDMRRRTAPCVLVALAACGSVTGPHIPDAEIITVESVTVTPPTKTVERGLDAAVQLAAIANLNDGATKDVTEKVIWSSSDVTIATVDQGLVTYVGPGMATISADLDGVMGTAAFTVSDPTLVVASLGNAGLDFFPAYASGDTAPIRSIRGNMTGLGAVWDVRVEGQEVFVSGPGSITVFPVDGSGNIGPTRQIIGATTGLSGTTYGMVIHNGEIYLGDSGNKVSVFPIDATGNVAPTRVLTGAMTGLSFPVGLAIYQDELYVTNEGLTTITVYPADASGNVAPTRTISGASTALANPINVLVHDGELIVSNFGNNTLTSYLANSNGDVPPLRVIAGSSTALGFPDALFLLGDELYSANGTSSSVQVHSWLASGNIAPTRALVGPTTLIEVDRGLWIY
jgi:hypothetical protein